MEKLSIIGKFFHFNQRFGFEAEGWATFDFLDPFLDTLVPNETS